ncbi:MAG TPA: type II toxin-antitoxin system VapC family toxin [Actinophytocola sp.]|nr:type II toxin-antitoxin system VapC family toxin [Actinophytocola sp.]
MRRVIIDTDVASLSIKNRLPPTLLRELVGAQVGITFITLGELVRWATMRSWGPERRSELNQWLASRPTLPYTDDIARTWGDISAHAARRGRPRPQNDTWIAACCLAYDLPLATLNIKDFTDFGRDARKLYCCGPAGATGADRSPVRRTATPSSILRSLF